MRVDLLLEFVPGSSLRRPKTENDNYSFSFSLLLSFLSVWADMVAHSSDA
jgi:hypothetical protein